MLNFKVERIESTSDELSLRAKYSLILHIGGIQKVFSLKRTETSGTLYTADSALPLKVLACERITLHIHKDDGESNIGSAMIRLEDPGLYGIGLYTDDVEPKLVGVLRVSVMTDVSESRRPSGSIPSEPDAGNVTVGHSSVTADILSHFFSDISSAKQLIETYKKWAIRCGPLRFLFETFTNIGQWKDPHATILLLVLWIWVCCEPQIALVYLLPLGSVSSLYYLLLHRTGALQLQIVGSANDLGFVAEDVEANLKFNNRMMSVWCDMYDACKSMNLHTLIRVLHQVSIYWVCVSILGLILLYALPTYVSLIVAVGFPLLITSPAFRSRKAVVSSLLKQSTHHPQTLVFEVYENQRWWLGNWSDKGLAIGTAQIFPWSDFTGKVAKNKSEISLPPGFEWHDLWHVDERGWMYAINFETEWFHADQRTSDFVRRRRWIRTAHVVGASNS